MRKWYKVHVEVFSVEDVWVAAEDEKEALQEGEQLVRDHIAYGALEFDVETVLFPDKEGQHAETD